MSNFRFIMAADAQYPWTTEKDTGMKFEGDWVEETIRPSSKQYDSAKEYAEKQVESINNAGDIKGVMINGDLVESNSSGTGQKEKFQEYYEKINCPLYFGLGNHDYQNYVDDTFENRGATEMVRYLYDRIKDLPKENRDAISVDDYGQASLRTTITGSLSYSFDIENIHFIQLNNFPGYERKWSAFDSSKARRFTVNITSSLEWLEIDLIKARNAGKAIIVCTHKEPALWENTVEYCNLLRTYGVTIVFVGHEHTSFGPSVYSYTYGEKEYEMKFVYCGATSQCNYVELSIYEYDNKQKLEIQGISSIDGEYKKIANCSETYEMDTTKPKEPYPIPTPKGYVTFDNEGAFVAKCYLEYKQNGKKVKVDTGSLAVGNAETLNIPAKCSDFKIWGKVHGLFVWYDSFFEFKSDKPFDCTYELSGTTTSPKIKKK